MLPRIMEERFSDELSRVPAAWALIATTLACDVMGFGVSGLRFDRASALLPVSSAVGLFALGHVYRRRDIRIAETLNAVAQLVAFTAGCATLSYLVASLRYPLWDESLHAWDRALGLDWRAYLVWADAHPTIGLVLSCAYSSLTPQMIVICAALGLTGRLGDLRVFIVAFIIAGLVTVLVSGAMPAMAMYVHLGLTPADYPHLNPAAAKVHVAALEALRAGAMPVISLDKAEGLITFPSFHAALGAIYAFAFRNVRWLRWPGLVLNLGLIAATPIDGGHYFVDVIAGLGLAALSLAVARRLVGSDAHDRQVAPAPALPT